MTNSTVFVEGGVVESHTILGKNAVGVDRWCRMSGILALVTSFWPPSF